MKHDEFKIICERENHWELEDHCDHTIDLKSEYDHYWQKIRQGDHFAISRCADGERSLMLGKKVHAQEGWKADSGITLLGKDLNDSLSVDDPRFVYAISCPCCDSSAYYWYLHRLKGRPITFSNLFINANFSRFKQDFLTLDREAVLITNYRGKGKAYGNLKIKRHYTIDDDCVNFWKEQSRSFVNQIIEEVGDEKDLLFAVSAGPMSCLIIKALFENNPENTYIDFGSSLDFITHDNNTRPYMTETSPYAYQNCWMFRDPEIEVDVVLSAYKRVHVLQQQIDAIRAQTLQPSRILLYQDAVAGSKIVIDQKILDQLDDYEIAEENGGVWKRFEYAAKKATAPFVCVFDDDTIPGHRWLENCHIHAKQQEGVYGTNGIVVISEDSYPNSAINIGWHGPSNTAMEVDFVGHSWFVRREHLQWLMKKSYDVKYGGEDMALSFACQKHGVPTFVPPHPRSILNLWGSIPEFGGKYGADENAMYLQGNPDMGIALKKIREDGWNFLFEREPYYVAYLRAVKELNRQVIINHRQQKIIDKLQKDPVRRFKLSQDL